MDRSGGALGVVHDVRIVSSRAQDVFHDHINPHQTTSARAWLPHGVRTSVMFGARANGPVGGARGGACVAEVGAPPRRGKPIPAEPPHTRTRPGPVPGPGEPC